MGTRLKSRGHTGKERQHFGINVKLYTGEIFPLKNITGDMKISDLKQYMEFATGIPLHMQRISYLDDGDLLDNSYIRSNDIVPGATLHLRVWPMWKELIDAAASNDIDWVFDLGVTNPTTYQTPQSAYMTKRARKTWLEERAFLALFIAAHRGHENLVKKLIESGADVNASTPLGRTALHVAAAQDRGNIVDLLLEKGADIDAEDDDGSTALSIAAKFNHKRCERHLFLFRWQERAKRICKGDEPERMAHQYFDSSFPVWLKGDQCQLYFTNILPPGEYEGTRMGSPCKSPQKGLKSDGTRLTFEEELETDAYSTSGGIRLPVIREERAKKSKSGINGRALSFTDWLGRKQAIEQKVIDVKKREEDRKKMEEEDKKELEQRLEAEKSQSYETWLAQQEKDKKENKRVEILLPPKEKDDPLPIDKGPGYLRTYLRSLGKTKTGDTYEDWLTQKEQQLGIPVATRARSAKLPISTY